MRGRTEPRDLCIARYQVLFRRRSCSRVFCLQVPLVLCQCLVHGGLGCTYPLVYRCRLLGFRSAGTAQDDVPVIIGGLLQQLLEFSASGATSHQGLLPTPTSGPVNRHRVLSDTFSARHKPRSPAESPLEAAFIPDQELRARAKKRKGLPRSRLDVQFRLTKMPKRKRDVDVPAASGAPAAVHHLRTIR